MDFDEYMVASQRMEAPGSIESYMAQKNSVGRIVEPVASNAPVVTLVPNGTPANGIPDWLKQNWAWIALGGLAVLAFVPT